MKKLILITIVLLILGCATTPTKEPLVSPKCEEGTLFGLCITEDVSSFELIGPNDYCPSKTVYFGPVFRTDCFSSISNYIEELELRVD